MFNLYHSIHKVQRNLNQAGIDSIVIGGMAVAVWGEPRLTRDVDLKVLVSREQAAMLLELLGREYRSLADDPAATLRRQGLLFVEDLDGTRIDLLLADTPYDIHAIQRRQAYEVQPGILIQICSPEDLIIYKMISTRPRDAEDVEGIIRRQKESLDAPYILVWLRQFEQALDDSTLVKEFQRLMKS